MEPTIDIGDIVKTKKGANFSGRVIGLYEDYETGVPGAVVQADREAYRGTKHVYPLAQLEIVFKKWGGSELINVSQPEEMLDGKSMWLDESATEPELNIDSDGVISREPTEVPHHHKDPKGYGWYEPLTVLKEGQESRRTGKPSPYDGQSVQHQLHAYGWVCEDLRLALIEASPKYAKSQGLEGKSGIIGEAGVNIYKAALEYMFGEVPDEVWFNMAFLKQIPPYPMEKHLEAMGLVGVNELEQCRKALRKSEEENNRLSERNIELENVNRMLRDTVRKIRLALP